MRFGLALIILLFGISGPIVHAATEDDKITADDPTTSNALFGFSVDISGTTVVVGALGNNDAGTFAGSAYVFDCSSFPCGQVSKLTASDAAGGDTFGWSVAVSGTNVVVGAIEAFACGPVVCGSFGSAYYFDLSTCGAACTETSKLTASDATRASKFGFSVAVDGTTAVVGVFRSELAYLFDLSSCGAACTETDKLTPSDSVSGDLFGTDVAICGPSVVVGAALDDDVVGDSGSAYVFDCSGLPCVQVSKLTASDPVERAGFGERVAVSGTTAVVGQGASSDGSVYYFDLSTCGAACTETGKLTASDAAAIGGTPDVSGKTAVAGGGGAVYYFDLSTCGAACTEAGKLTPSDPGNNGFGASEAVSGNTVVVGAPNDDGPLPDSGSAYLFSVSIDADGDGVPDADDVCDETRIPEGVPTVRLGTNRFALIDGDSTFDTSSPMGGGPDLSFTIEDTAGCSCEQIIAALEFGKGHVKFGCSISAMEGWVALVSP